MNIGRSFISPRVLNNLGSAFLDSKIQALGTNGWGED